MKHTIKHPTKFTLMSRLILSALPMLAGAGYASYSAYSTLDVSFESRADSMNRDAELNSHLKGSILFILGSLLVGLIPVYFTLRNATRELSRPLKALEEGGAELAGSSQQLGGVSEELSQATTEQASAIQESVSALAEMTSMIQQTSENAKKSLQTSKNVQERSEVGQDIMRRMVVAMDAIDQTNKSLQGIGQIIHAINVKAGVINDIVFKTQLLSFNASIEAARAGQYGKGFSVVAEEVGNLAQMSGESAKEIESLLADSQKQVSSTLELIRQRVGESKIVTDESVRTFNEIAESIREITGQIKNISDATTQQSVGVEQTQKALSQLDQMARQNAATAQVTLKSTQSLSGVSAKIDQSYSDIRRILTGDAAELKSMPTQNVLSGPISDSMVDTQDSLKIPPQEIHSDDESFTRAA